MSDYSKLHDRDYQKLYDKYEAALSENKDLKRINKSLTAIVESTARTEALLIEMKDIINSQNNEMKELREQLKAKDELLIKALEEIERLKNNNKKDSSNSSKPSSTNGSKKVISNRREKSTKPQGGQKGHDAHNLKEAKVEAMLNLPNVEYRVVELPKGVIGPKYKIDIESKVVITKFLSLDDSYDKLNPVQYGNNIKSNAILLSIDNYMSTDGIIKYFNAISNGVINLSKGTLCNWFNEFRDKCATDIETIIDNLLLSYYLNVDDSQIKINGENFNQLCMCNDLFSYLVPSKHKNKESWDKTPLAKYIGRVIKDGADIFSSYGISQAQCLSHILRYIKAAIDFGGRKSVVKLKRFLEHINSERNRLIALKVEDFNSEAIKRIEDKYDSLINEWEKEFSPYADSLVYVDEKRLLNRMKENDRKEILAFIYDFKIPSTNNQAEVDQRGLKVKQKIGKFRSETGANTYCTAKSIILTLKKHKMRLLESISSIFDNKPVLAK